MIDEGAFITTKKKMEDVSTRFAVLSDYQEYLEAGLDAVTNSLTRFPNEKDRGRKRNLQASILLLNNYKERLSNYDGQKYAMNKILDSCVPSKEVLNEIRASRAAAAKSAPTAIDIPAAAVERSDADETDGTDDGDVSFR